MVCRVFQKCTAARKPQQTSSSQPESPCDTTSIVNDQFGDVELPNLNLNGIANSSISCGFTNISEPTFNTDLNSQLTMNWPAASEVASLSSLAWPSGLLNPNAISVNSLLLKALQLRSYQQKEAAIATNQFASYIPQGVSHLGSGTDPSSSNLSASSSKVLECMPQHQQEQPFNLDSIW